MATLQEKANVATESSFEARCLMARVLVAIDVLIAPEGEYTQSDITYARQVFMNPLMRPERVTVAVVSQESIADAESSEPGSAPDQDIMDRIRAAWTYLQ